MTMSQHTTPNEKLSRDALAETEGQASGGRSAEAQTPVEEILTGIWKQVLGVQSIDVNSTFFELGGDSLMGTQIGSRIEQVLGVDVPLGVIFEFPSVAALAEKIKSYREERREGAPSASLLEPVEPVVREKNLPVTFSQAGRLYFERYAETRKIPFAPHLQKYYYHLEGELDEEALERSLREIVGRHESLRSTFYLIDDLEPFHVVLPPSAFSLDSVDLTHVLTAEHEEVVLRILAERSESSGRLSQEIPFKVVLLKFSETTHYMLVLVHHIVWELWSEVVFEKEFVRLYRAFHAGEESPLPPLTIQLSDYAAWQRKWVRGEKLESLSSYWKKQLAGMGPVPAVRLTEHMKSTEAQTYAGATETLRLPDELTERLRNRASQGGFTLYMLLLTGLKALLHHYIKEEDIGILSPVAARHMEGSENLIGWLNNVLVFRTDLSGDPTLGELASRVRNVVIEGYAHQDLPYAKLIEVLGHKHEARRPYVFFNVFPFILGDADLDLPKLKVRRVRVEFPDEVTAPGLNLLVLEDETTNVIVLKYEAELFSPDTIKGFLLDYQKILEAICSNPEQKLSACL